MADTQEEKDSGGTYHMHTKMAKFAPQYQQMRTLVLAFLLTMSLHSCREDDITGTQQKCKEINEHLPEYKRKNIESSIQSENVTSLTIYLKDDKIALAVAASYTETDRSTSKYYFDNNKLMCVVQEEYTYNKPTYVTEEKALKNGDTVWYDDTKTKHTTSRYYFYDGRMVKWVDKDNKVIPESNKRYDLQTAILLKDADKIKRMNAVAK